jgi:hypothetical protein
MFFHFLEISRESFDLKTFENQASNILVLSMDPEKSSPSETLALGLIALKGKIKKAAHLDRFEIRLLLSV